jgi:hypothetical protein
MSLGEPVFGAKALFFPYTPGNRLAFAKEAQPLT